MRFTGIDIKEVSLGDKVVKSIHIGDKLIWEEVFEVEQADQETTEETYNTHERWKK